MLRNGEPGNLRSVAVLEGVVMQVAVVTFDGFNELDSFIASALINRCRKDGLKPSSRRRRRWSRR